uniref:Uncharacterized protein n=1 Tax=Chenopodium quinoa TaxID=63459 RepID=A0A803MD87_CHEQI
MVDLSGRSLDSLPNPSINLAAIWKLDLSNNNLENRLLEELNANFNKLTSLPDTIGFELLNLKKLSVNSNKIAFLPFSICHATSLRVLDVRLNCLRSLPEDLENLINLEILNVSQNFQYLVELPYSIGLLMSLVELDVSYNKISELPTSLGCLRKLQKLHVEGNPLVSPPLEVMEQGLHAVRQYMTEKINGYHQDSPKKKSWFKNLKKYGNFYGNGNATPGRRSYEIERGFVLPEYRPIDALASPRYNFGMFSPKRFFSSSPRKSFTNYFSKFR